MTATQSDTHTGLVRCTDFTDLDKDYNQGMGRHTHTHTRMTHTHRSRKEVDKSIILVQSEGGREGEGSILPQPN